MSLTRPISPDLDAWVDDDPELAHQLRHSLSASIGESLRVARTHAGMSQAEVATAMGVTRPRIAQIEGAEGSALSLGVLARYAAAVGCRLDILFVEPATEALVTNIVVADVSAPEEPAATHEPRARKARTRTEVSTRH